jgi:hypothetical protein
MLADSVKRGKLTEEKRDALLADQLITSDDYAALGQADVIIEAVFESMDVKREVFGKLDRVAKPGAVLASNTSYLDVDEIAAATSRPGRCAGPAFLLARACHAPAGSGRRRPDGARGGGHRFRAGQGAQEDPGPRRGLRRLHRQPDAARLPAGGRSHGPRRRLALRRSTRRSSISASPWAPMRFRISPGSTSAT